MAGGKREEKGRQEEDEQERVKVTVSLGNVSMTGGYQVSGKLASLFPIQGDGLMSATFFNITAATVLWMEKEKVPSSSFSSSTHLPSEQNGTWKNHLTIQVDSIDLEGVEMKIESNDHKNALHEGYNEEASESNITSTSLLVDHSNHTTHHSYHSLNSFTSPSLSPNESSESNNESHTGFESMLFWRLVSSLQQKLQDSVVKCLQEVMRDRQ